MPKVLSMSGKEIGWSGLERLAGLVSGLDPNPKFDDLETSIDQLDWMYRADPQIRSMVKITILPISRSEPYLIGSTPLIRKRVEENLFQNKFFDFPVFLRDAGLHVVYGFALFEKVWNVTRSRVDLKKLAYRHQTSVDSWKFNEKTEDLEGVKQIGSMNTSSKPAPFIPRSKLVLFVNDGEGQNPQGTSLIRPAYFPFILKEAVLKVIGIHHERWGGGIPNIEIDESVLHDPMYDRVMKIIETLRTHQKSGVISIKDKIEIKMIPAPAASMAEAMLSTVRYLDNAIAKCMFAQFSNVGTGEIGSHASAQVLVDLFIEGLQAIADYMAGVITREIIQDIVTFNFGDQAKVPRLAFSNIAANLKGERILNAITQGAQTQALSPQEAKAMFRAILGARIDAPDAPPDAPPDDLQPNGPDAGGANV